MAAALQEESEDLRFAAQSRPAQPRPVEVGSTSALESLLATAAIGEPVIPEEEPKLVIPNAPRRAPAAVGRSRRPPSKSFLS